MTEGTYNLTCGHGFYVVIWSVQDERAGAGKLEGSCLVLEKNHSEDCCGDKEERSSDIISHVTSCLFVEIDVMMQMFMFRQT